MQALPRPAQIRRADAQRTGCTRDQVATVRGDLALAGHVQELANDTFDKVRVTVLAVVF